MVIRPEEFFSYMWTQNLLYVNIKERKKSKNRIIKLCKELFASNPLTPLGSRWKEIQRKRVEACWCFVITITTSSIMFLILLSLSFEKKTQKTSFSIIRLKFVLLFNWKRNSHFKSPLRRWKCWLDIEHHPSNTQVCSCSCHHQQG